MRNSNSKPELANQMVILLPLIITAAKTLLLGGVMHHAVALTANLSLLIDLITSGLATYFHDYHVILHLQFHVTCLVSFRFGPLYAHLCAC